MKAVLTDERFSDPAWIYERKLDGIRCLATKGDKRVDLRSRNDLSLNGRFPEIAAALEADPATNLVVDGEVVAFDGAQTSFARLQQRGEHADAGLLLRLRHPARSTARTSPRCRCASARRACASARLRRPDPLHDRTATATARRSTRRRAARAGRA